MRRKLITGVLVGLLGVSIAPLKASPSYAVSSSVATLDTTSIKTGIVNCTSALNVRSGVGTSYSKIGSLANESKVNIVDEVDGWYKIEYGSGYGYVSGKYIVISTNSEQASSKIGVVNCNTTLNVRSGAGTSYSKLGYLVNGAKVTIVSETDGWYKIKYNSGYGYVSGKYIKVSESGDTDKTSKETGVVNCNSSLNVRSGAGTSYSKIGYLLDGAKVTIVGETDGWYKIEYGSGYGYVSGSYIKTASSTVVESVKSLDGFLFVGDSYTYNIRNVIYKNTDGAIIKAKGSIGAHYWINNFSQMPSNSSVKGVVLQIGINHIGESYNIPDTKTLIKKLSDKYYNKTVYVHRLFPVGYNYYFKNIYTTQEQIKEFNSKIKAYCNTIDNVKYIDATKGFIDSNGYLKYEDPEGLHISWQKFDQYYENIENAIKNS